MSLLSSLTLADFSVVPTPSPDASVFLNHYNVTASDTNNLRFGAAFKFSCASCHIRYSCASTDDDRSRNTGYDFDIHGGVVLYAADDLDARGLYAADDFDTRELYAAADDIRGGPLDQAAFRFASRAAAGDRAGPAASTALAPAGRFARVRRILRSVGRRLRRFLPK
ncbi:hypothetical protein B0H15DRAFT_958441 [Mycena belliarum]|uniref:Uncharacterized protein n=1 Tax=Mycena belliarum TaxID=1033014 RepID=A0AAD6TQW5_9AGAR|nr:hypothetical protein B0H15DRAFT_958441 [Mycena belliae]